MSPPADLPVLVVGDVHGDLQRLFRALQPYPPDRWRTIFLGDLVDGGDFGVGALRYAGDRPNSTVLIGNHEVAMLWALRDRSTLGSWQSVGGQLHDLAELERDDGLLAWLRRLPALVKLEDGTLFQHSDNDGYARLAGPGEVDLIEAINRESRRLLESGEEALLWDILTPGGVFRADRGRLVNWLQRTGARRLVHGHKPHLHSQPDVYHDGLAISFDGAFSRFRGGRFPANRSLAATVSPLPPLS